MMITRTYLLLTVSFLLTAAASASWGHDEGATGHGHEDITELSIEELMNVEVFGASKYNQRQSEAPSSVSVVTADEIRKYGYRTLADILGSIRGFYTTYDRNYDYVGVRGFNRPGDYNTRVLLLVDGHRINENIFDQAIIGTEFILDADLIDRVEIIRGPGSSLYGSNAFFGVVNVVTKSGRDLTGAEVSAEAGSFDTYKGRMSYGNSFSNGPETVISGSVYDSEGPRHLYYKEFDTSNDNNGVADDADDDKSRSFFTKTSFGDFILTGAYSLREKGIPTASFETAFNDKRNRTVDEHGYVDLRYSSPLSGSAEVLSRLYFDYFKYYGHYAYPPPDGVLYDYGQGAWWGAEAQISQAISKQKMIAGVDYRNNIRQHMLDYYQDPYYSILDENRRSVVWAVFAQDEIRFLDALFANIGVRYDHYESFGSSTNPRLALVYQPQKKTSLKLLYGRAFRAPNIYELYYQDNGLTAKANPDLAPEKNRTYELAYERYVGDHLRSSLSGYYYEVDNLITAVTDPSDGLTQFRNVDNVHARGVEMEMEGRWKDGLHVRMSYALQHAEDNATDQPLTNSPRHMAKLNTIIPLDGERLSGDVELQYLSRRKTLAGNYAHDFTIVNLTLFSHAVMKGLDVSTSVYNVFDRRYGDPGAGVPQHMQDIIEQDGRTYRVKLTYAF